MTVQQTVLMAVSRLDMYTRSCLKQQSRLSGQDAEHATGGSSKLRVDNDASATRSHEHLLSKQPDNSAYRLH
jgi:hypothetical protein